MGFSYGSGATIFPQSIGNGSHLEQAKPTEDVAMAVGDVKLLAAGTMQAWSPVLMWQPDARWGRCEETFQKTLCWYHKLVELGLKDINLKACLLLRNIWWGMPPFGRT